MRDQQCEGCELRYRDFRTGFTYRGVWELMLDYASEDPTKWKYKRRNAVLGKWHEIKKQMWAEHQAYCSGTGRSVDSRGQVVMFARSHESMFMTEAAVAALFPPELAPVSSMAEVPF